MRSATTTVAGIVASLLSLSWLWVDSALLGIVWQIGVDKARCDAQGGCNLLGDPLRPAPDGATLPHQPGRAWTIGWLILALLVGAAVAWGLVAGANLIRGRRWACHVTVALHLVGAVSSGLMFNGEVADDARTSHAVVYLAMFGASTTVVVLATVGPRAPAPPPGSQPRAATRRSMRPPRRRR